MSDGEPIIGWVRRSLPSTRAAYLRGVRDMRTLQYWRKFAQSLAPDPQHALDVVVPYGIACFLLWAKAGRGE